MSVWTQYFMSQKLPELSQNDFVTLWCSILYGPYNMITLILALVCMRHTVCLKLALSLWSIDFRCSDHVIFNNTICTKESKYTRDFFKFIILGSPYLLQICTLFLIRNCSLTVGFHSRLT